MQGQMQLKSYFTDEVFVFEGLPLLTASARLPFWTGKGGRHFNRYYRAYSRAFLSCCRDTLFPRAQEVYHQALESAGALPQWQATLDTTVTSQTPGLVSLYTDSIHSGEGQRVILRRGDTWQLATGYPAALSDFFPARSFWRRRLLDTAAAQIRQEEEHGIARYAPDWTRRLRTAFSPQQFYLTPEGLCFFYQIRTLAPPVEGLPTFCLPYDAEKGPFPPEHFGNKS